jgi:hypothetical protein
VIRVGANVGFVIAIAIWGRGREGLFRVDLTSSIDAWPMAGSGAFEP